uniref:Transcription activation suppressor b n=1 Tax=Astyanax mexicanus TaxID=7994 RepID=A0A8B9LA82_ASTMX
MPHKLVEQPTIVTVIELDSDFSLLLLSPSLKSSSKLLFLNNSREFEELVKVLSSFYLDAPSRGAFTYTKACLIHNELLEKEFVEKKRELKQAGRTEAELTESYAFLLPDTNKTHWICEKGLSVGHARLSNLGNPAKGVYLSKYSDLLQINPFDAGASGDIIIFKVMKGRLKSIFENMPKSNLEPAPKFDCHVHKNASKVTSLLSYRAFELTQQYFYEFAFDELKSRPRHVCPYAVVSFQYKGKESATAAHRYTVWSGPLVNKGEELYQVCIRSPSLPFLPLKLPDKIDISMVMHLDQVKRKIPSTLLSWDTYSGTREALKCGMYASLFEVMGKTKQGNCLSGLLQRMEREKMVLVKPLVDRGFLFLLSSSHMHSSNERRGRSDRGLQALFIFQEPRIMTRSCMYHYPITEHLHTFVPALHHAFFKLRSNPPRDLGAGVKNQALDYLGVQEQGMGRPFLVPEYRTSMDERPNLHPAPRPKGMDSALSSYMYGPSKFQLPVTRLQQGLLDSGQRGSVSPPGGGAEEYSPVSDWGGSDRASSSGRAGPAPAQSNGSAQRVQKSQTDYEKEKMEKLLKLIQLHKRARGKDDVGEPERSDEWDAAGLKRRLEGDMPSSVSKYLNTGLLSNGEQGRGEQVSDSGVDVLVANKSGQAGGKMLDTILDQEFQNLCTGIQKVMDSHQILYVPQPQPPWHKGKVNGLDSTFSSYVSNYVSPPTVQTYVNSLCEKMNRMIRSPGAPSNSLANPAAPTVTAPLPAPVPSSQAAAAPPSTIPAPPPALPSKPPAPNKPPRLGTVKEVHMAIPGKKTDPKVPNIAESPVCLPSAGIPALPLIPELPPDPAQVGGSNVIGQIKPEVLCTLMEIMQMNAVRFYIKRGEQDENELCTEIKVYLQNLGNIECDPQTYLENNCQQKFMVIIQNEDIATHVHKIPALVSLKKLSTVYFAGVDSLDDVKNRTYNELFVSGGLIVSDERNVILFVWVAEKMQMFLQFLESQNLSWKWKVHCKTQKKLKELSRLNSEALDLLNLLTIYQKKHLVEFLPYHECDAPSRQAPDLDCLVKLQAQHSQLRHIIFLTGTMCLIDCLL